MHEKDKEDVIRFGQNVHTTQTFSKKETLKRPVSSLEDSIMKLLTLEFTCILKRSGKMSGATICYTFFHSPSYILNVPGI